MKLNAQSLEKREAWERAGFILPRFDVSRMVEETAAAPAWVHFGAGNLFRAFPAAVQQHLLDLGAARKGIVVAEGYDYEIVDRLYLPHDNLSLLVTLKADGAIEKTVVASVAEAVKADSNDKKEFGRLLELFENPALQMASFTITEKGYCLRQANGALLPAVEADFAAGPEQPQSYLGKLAALLYRRYQAGRLPLALVSMDNCSHNGTRLYDAIRAFAGEWAARGLADEGFPAYVDDRALVSFPWTMIDKITPRPDESVRAMLEEDGFEDTEGTVTAKRTYCAPFVNAEETQYLVVEDWFPNGRPPLEAGGVIFTDRETVDKVEKMKVCTCLNPLHTALAVFGCLLGFERICDEMKDPELRALAERVGRVEGLPVVTDPGVIDPEQFLREVLETRLPNPFMPDTPQRIATDTSQKLPVRFGETIKAYQTRLGLDVGSLTAIPLVLAGWCRYVMGVDDNGKPFEPSPDPLLEAVRPHLEGVRLGQTGPFHEVLEPVLSDVRIFGGNLYEAGLGGRVEIMFAELVAGPGAVRATLGKYLAAERG